MITRHHGLDGNSAIMEMDRIEHELRKDQISIPRKTLECNHERKRKTGTRTVQTEATAIEQSWGTLRCWHSTDRSERASCCLIFLITCRIPAGKTSSKSNNNNLLTLTRGLFFFVITACTAIDLFSFVIFSTISIIFHQYNL